MQELGFNIGDDYHLISYTQLEAYWRKLARYKDISHRLAGAEGLTDESARALAQEGRAVVWIDGGLHATEVVAWSRPVQDRTAALNHLSIVFEGRIPV